MVKVQRETLRQELLKNPRYDEPKRLTRHAHKVFSQYGEDGMIAEIFRRIGLGDRTFVEIGTGDGTETNTTFLLLQGWSGSWVECSSAAMQSAQQYRAYYPINPITAFVTRENVDQLINSQIPDGKELSLLSIDVDFNDYWLWDAVTARPRVFMVEYNATIPPDVSAAVAYNPDAVWQGSVYFGGSLAAFVDLGQKKGYSLVGCTLEGLNAFFVRDDLLGDHFYGPFSAENHYEPPRYWLAPPAGHFAGFGKWELLTPNSPE